jgi:hypothetical protein
MRIRHSNNEGLVPASYVEITPHTPRPPSTYSNSSSHTASSIAGAAAAAGASKKKGPAVAPKRGAKRLKYVEALYDYEARTDVEHNMAEGERFVLIRNDEGDGWCEVEKGGVVKSVPRNYVGDV